MNKRIQELAKKADPEYTGEYDDNMGHALIGDTAIEKFAELIIRECANICDIESRLHKHFFTPAKARLAESTSKHCATVIRNYFGVE